jgi:A/G-specific adenine glycosylase
VAYEARHDYAVVLRNARRQFWLRQCGEDEEWSGLWDLPRVRFGAQPSRKPDGELPAQFARQFGLHVTLKNPLMQLRHGVTRYRITLHVFDASPRAALLRNAEYRRKMNWFDAEQLPELPLHVTARRVLSRVLQSDA